MIRSISLAALALAFSSAQANHPVAGSTSLPVDAAATKLEWMGQKPKVLGYKHTGTVNVKNGHVDVKDNQVVGGEVIIDMTTIQVTDLEGEKAQGLKNHLTVGNDFFAVYEPAPEGAPKGTVGPVKPENATAKLHITNVTKATKPGHTHDVTADLTIRGKTAPVTFPATIDVKDGLVMAKAQIPVNRTKYDVKFASTVMGAVGDKLIDDVFTVDVNLTAKGETKPVKPAPKKK